MKIAILDDYQDQVRHLPCFALLAGHDVTILNQSEPDTARLAAMLEDESTGADPRAYSYR